MECIANRWHKLEITLERTTQPTRVMNMVIKTSMFINSIRRCAICVVGALLVGWIGCVDVGLDNFFPSLRFEGLVFFNCCINDSKNRNIFEDVI